MFSLTLNIPFNEKKCIQDLLMSEAKKDDDSVTVELEKYDFFKKKGFCLI